MKYIYIENKEQFEKNYPYKKIAEKDYPNFYPCVLGLEFEEGGLGGCYWITEIIDISKNNDFLFHNGNLYKKI